jgi:hypothetical protein
MGSIEPYKTVSGRRYRVRYRTPDHRQTDKRGFKTKRDAEQFAASVEVKKARGEFIDPAAGRISIGSLGEQWLNSRSDLKASTVYVYRSAWRLHVAPVWADRSLASVRNSEVTRDQCRRQREGRAADARSRVGRHDPRHLQRPLRR